jgi:endonuclease YncB( thermonuclease family)
MKAFRTVPLFLLLAVGALLAGLSQYVHPGFAAEPGGFRAGAKGVVGKVVAVCDGDTVTVLDRQNQQVNIGLNGIDAPALKQAFGEQSRQGLSSKVLNKDVTVYLAADQNGRTVGDLYLGNRWINLEMVEDGLAWHLGPVSGSKELAKAEDMARKKRLGLWADSNRVPPWEFQEDTGKVPGRGP